MQLNYQRDGNGPTLIILHGLFGNLSNWKTISRRLAQNFDTIVVDARNHGRSPWHDEVSYPVMAMDIKQLMDELGIDRAGIVGHSMGGKTAMTLALTIPERLSGIVIVDIAPVVYSHSHIDLIDTLLRLDLGSARKRQDVDQLMQAEIADAGLRQFLSQNLVFRDGQFAWRINLKALAAGMDNLTGFPQNPGNSYSGPALFIHGKNSDYVQDRHHDEIVKLFPHAVFKGVDNAGHWVHAQAPDRVTDEIESLFRSGE